MKTISDNYEALAQVTLQSTLISNSPYPKAITSGTILETFTSFEIELELPDTATEDCMISIEKRILIISGSGIKDLELDLLSMSGERFRRGRFSRFILLLAGFGNERLQATCNDGLLYIHIPKGLLVRTFASEIGSP